MRQQQQQQHQQGRQQEQQQEQQHRRQQHRRQQHRSSTSSSSSRQQHRRQQHRRQQHRRQQHRRQQHRRQQHRAAAAGSSSRQQHRSSSSSRRQQQQEQQLSLLDHSLKKMQSELAAQLMATLEQWHPPLEGDDVNPVLAFARQWLQKAQDCELVSMGTRRQEEWGRGIVTVVKQGDESVAMVMWSQPTRRSERRGCILELWRTIAKSDHGQKSLLFFLKKARQKGYTQAMVEGSQCTQTLVPFYQSCGFGRVGDGSSWSMQTALLEVVEEEEQQRQDPEEEQEEEEEEYSALIPLLQRQVLCVDTTASTPSTLR